MSEAPAGAARPEAGTRGEGRSFEAWSWVFMRVSGIALVFLALLHFAITHILNDVVETDYRFVADRWRSVWWRLFDWALLVLALVHGANGVRWIIDDYVRRDRPRAVARRTVYVLTALLLAWGTFTIVAFPG